MKMARLVAINGFGRIGRMVFRALVERQEDIEVAAINDLVDIKTLAHLLKYDSTYGRFPYPVKTEGDKLIVEAPHKTFEIKCLREPNPDKLPWKDMGVYLAIESTGVFRKREQAELHLKAGAEKVLVTAPMKPADSADIQILIGINDKDYDPKKHRVLSLASCTTNAVAPTAYVLHKKIGIKSALMSTVHAVTNDQRLLDRPHRDLRRARAAPWNIIPTTTGAAEAAALAIPELKGKMTGLALRVPVITGSIVDLTAVLEKEVTKEEVNALFKEASETYLKGILGYTEEPIVSTDIIKDPHSGIVDGLSTIAIGNLVKVLVWYDNEWGYSNRVVDMMKIIVEKG